jgi:formate dehydrogenase major subunit
VIEGSNMAECHPVGFQWVVEAKERGAKVIHVDPRFTRTSAIADLHVPIRAGTDIAFLGGIVNYIIENERYFFEYVTRYTNASTIIDEGYRDTEDLDGLFSGWDEDEGAYDTTSWQYDGMQSFAAAGKREQGAMVGHQAHGAHGGELEKGEPPRVDHSLQDPRCVFQILKRHFRRYTPEAVERICGIPRETFLEVAGSLCENSGRERTSALVYSVGWTQHTVGVQYIRTAAIIQLLLGNMGRPGGGIMALRGHASIQGSTDIPTLFDILPGYLPMPNSHAYRDLAEYIAKTSAPTGYWGHAREYMVSLLKAYWGDAATEENDYGFDWIPRLTGDHSIYPTVMGMFEGKCRGMFLFGENPAVGSSNSRLHRLAMANLEWLVVRDLQEIESANFWKEGPEIESGELVTEDIGTEVFFLPAAAHTEKAGTFTNTQRLLQWRHKAIDPPEDCRSDLWFTFHLGRLIKEKLSGSRLKRDAPIKAVTWDYPTEGPHDEPSPDVVLREISGFDSEFNQVPGYTALKGDGSTACGCWIYSGCYADGVNQPARRKPGYEQTWVAPEWGWAWPMNRRIIYNRASADPDGKPWSERKRYVWWDEEKKGWTGHDVPDFTDKKPPDYVPDEDATAEMALRGDEPFIVQADGRGWLFAPAGLVDGPLPTHYEPHESPFPNALYPEQRANPARQIYERAENESNPSSGEPGAEVFPYVTTTYRLTEHHTAGAMSRAVPYLAELQPEFFCEVSPELAAERNLRHGDWAMIVTMRTAIEARVMVTERIKPLRFDDRVVHQVGLPYHWGYAGASKGDSANDVYTIVLDPNVQIQEVKAASCDIIPGRRPRDSGLPEFVESYRERARAGNGGGP